MTDNFFEMVGEFGVRFGMTVMQKVAESAREVDRTALTNVVFDSAVEQAFLIVKHLGLIRQLDDEQFGVIVGIVGRSQLDMVECLTSTKLSLDRDLTRDVDTCCHQALAALRGQGAR